jgi:hypothetical protein
MQDRPGPVEFVTAVAAFLRDAVMPQSTGRAAFDTRIAINALELVARHLTRAEEAHAAEELRLEQLLRRTGPLTELNRDLCTRIADGSIAETDERLIRHLWATTMEKLAVDQPSYAAFREELQRTTGPEHGLRPSP